ncbi:cytochrome c oxidase subunit 6C-2-like [Saccoglossus kowalevskii]
MSIARPQMRGLLKSKIKRDLTIALIAGLAAAACVKFGYAERKKQTYANFYRDYDDRKAFEHMNSMGVFHATRPKKDD